MQVIISYKVMTQCNKSWMFFGYKCCKETQIHHWQLFDVMRRNSLNVKRFDILRFVLYHKVKLRLHSSLQMNCWLHADIFGSGGTSCLVIIVFCVISGSKSSLLGFIINKVSWWTDRQISLKQVSCHNERRFLFNNAGPSVLTQKAP